MNESQKNYNDMVYRLTRPFVSVIKFCTAYLGGRSYDFRGDSKTPFSDGIEYNDSLHYSNRHGLHLNPTKKRRFETLDNTKEMNDL
jgi:hypothetical protein